MFNEVLFHDVGSGYHLHLGGLRADSGNQQQQKRSADINSFMAAIAGQESGGSSDPYNLTNPDSGATGKFQIMPENWSSWAQDAGLSPDAPMTQENQNLVAKNKMLEYYNKFGNWRDVAIAWYGGEGAVGYSESAKNRPQGKYPSINQYADEVMGRLEKIVGSSVDTSTQAQGQSYSNPTTAQEQEQAQQQNEQSATKPLFDLNAEDDGSKSTLEMYNKFVEMFTNTTQGQQAAEVQNFFSTDATLFGLTDKKFMVKSE